MKKLSLLGIVGGALLLTAAPVSLQSQKNVSPTTLLTVSHADAQTAGMQRREGRRDTRQSRRQQRRSGQ
jgi:hypothetical protein